MKLRKWLSLKSESRGGTDVDHPHELMYNDPSSSICHSRTIQPVHVITSNNNPDSRRSQLQHHREGLMNTSTNDMIFSQPSMRHSSEASHISVGTLKNEVGSNTSPVIMTGWLEKIGQKFKTWKWRYFILRDNGTLEYYSDEQLKKMKGTINIGYRSNAQINVQSNIIDKSFIFMITTPQRNMVLAAPSRTMMSEWIVKFQAVGATPSEAWDPSKKTIKFFVKDAECPHEWRRYNDPTSYIHMEGYLMKRGHVNKMWKNRFFRIEQGELRYYLENQEELKGSIPLKGSIVSPGMAQCPDGRNNYFVLTSEDGKFELHLNAPNEELMYRWIEALQEAQNALADGNNTVQGLSLVIRRAEEIPLARIDMVYSTISQINVELERRTESLIVVACNNGTVHVGSQLIAVGNNCILRESYDTARKTLHESTFPLQLSFILPPYKRGELIKKSRSGLENWKRRVIVVTNGELRYFKKNMDHDKTEVLKFRKSFSLVGCYLNLIQRPHREYCIVVARSPSDRLVLQAQSEEERTEWASVIYCSIRIATQGLTPRHIANLHL